MCAERFSRDMAKVSLAKMLQTIGWNTINITPLEILSDILIQYLLQIAKTTNDYANEFGCTDPNLDHLGLAFRDCHVNLGELCEYVHYVDYAQTATLVPKYPIHKEDQLNFLKPGSKECLTRPVHIHEHLPPMYMLQEASEAEAESSVKSEKLDESIECAESENVFKRPAEVSPSETYKRIRAASETEEGRPTREIHSVMMTTSGFISPAREGRLPDSRTPVIVAPPAPPPPPPTPPILAPPPPPPLPPPPPQPPVTPLPSAALAVAPAAVTPNPIPAPILPPIASLLQHHGMQLPPKQRAEGSVVPMGAQNAVQMVSQAAQDQHNGNAAFSMAAVAGSSVGGGGGARTPRIQTPKKSKSPRRVDYRRKEKATAAAGAAAAAAGVSTGGPHEGGPHEGGRPRKSPSAAQKELSKLKRQIARQRRQERQQAQSQAQAQALLDQPINLSTTDAREAPTSAPVAVVLAKAAKAKAKANRTLAAARRKTEKLNTTITPIPMVVPMNTPRASPKAPTDKLLSEPDKNKLNILKKISNVVRMETPKAERIGKSEQQVGVGEHQTEGAPSIPEDVTISLVDIRHQLAPAQLQQLSMGTYEGAIQPPAASFLDDDSAPTTPLTAPKTPEIVPSPPMLLKDHKQKKRKERVKIKKMPKLLNASPHWDMEGDRPKTPELVHNFPKLPLSSGLPFPFLPQFSGPGLIPGPFPSAAFQNPLFPNHLLPPHVAAALTMFPPPPPHLAHGVHPSQQDGQQQLPYQPLLLEPLAPLAASSLPLPVAHGRPSKSRDKSSHIEKVMVPVAAHGQLTITPLAKVGSAPAPVSASASASAPVKALVIKEEAQPEDVAPTQPQAQARAIAEPSGQQTLHTASASRPASAPVPASAPLSKDLKSEKKNRDHKKDKKDKLRKKSKKDKIKNKAEKKKLKEELKVRGKKEKKEKKKMRAEHEMSSIPKLTLKLAPSSASASASALSPRTTLEQCDTKKLNIKPVVKKEMAEVKEMSAEGKRESSPELARISPLVTGLPKPKTVQPVSSPSFDISIVKKPMFKPVPKIGDILTEASACASTSASTSATAPIKSPTLSSKYIDSLGNEVWICPHCGKQDDGSPMIGCDDCDAWYHWVCVNMQVPPEENEDWYCKNCIKKRMQSSMPPEKKKKRKKKEKKDLEH